MGFEFSTLGNIERLERDAAYAELREIARIYDTTVPKLDQEVDAIEGAKDRAGRRKR